MAFKSGETLSFEDYKKRAMRQMELENLLNLVISMIHAHSEEDAQDALDKVHMQISKLEGLPPPDRTFSN